MSDNLIFIATIYKDDSGRATSCLLPVYDLFNHGAERNTFFTTTVNPNTNTYTYELKASRNISQGAEIYNQYGHLSDNQLFEQYGFAFNAENIPKNDLKLIQLNDKELMETCEKLKNCSGMCLNISREKFWSN